MTNREAWAVKLPQGSHRLRAAWVARRYEGLDAHGVPLEPDWEGSGCMVKILEDMRDVTQHGPEGCEVQLRCVKEPVWEPIVSIECDTDWSGEDVRSC